MSILTLLENWRNTSRIAQNIVSWRTFPGQAAQIASFPSDLHPALVEMLNDQGIDALYTHQASSWEQIKAGQHPVIVTGTASGKTLCYNLPVLHHLLSAPQPRALYLYPTKALAYDQMEALRRLVDREQPSDVDRQTSQANTQFSGSNLQSPFAIVTYDGDTPTSLRSTVRNHARIILSTPDMLHMAILPHHTKWADFLSHLRFVVIDEMHIYRGVFGSHVANVLRRLKRVAQFYGASPQFILTSATIANPMDLAERLIEEPVMLVNNDGAAKGPRHFLIYNPPVVNEAFGLRQSVLQESIQLTRALLDHDVQAIVFGRARRTVELLLRYLREKEPVAPAPAAFSSSKLELTESTALNDQLNPDGIHQIRAYRSGYLPRQRREVERGLRDGSVRAVVATSALELGVDIGGMGAAVLTGYPGTIAGAWQQSGRARRKNETALAVLITSASPLDQFLARHPDYFFERSPEQALINPDNLLILLQHLRCAAFELPFHEGDHFGGVETETLADFLQVLTDTGEVHRSGRKYFWMADRYPADSVSLRSASPHAVRLEIDTDGQQTTIGQVDVASAHWMVHPQAIYLHEGQSYLVEALDLDGFVARLRQANVDYYTEPKCDTTVQFIEQFAQEEVGGGTKHHGEIVVTTQVVGFRMIQWHTHERLGDGEVELPPNDLHTTGYWLTLAPETVAKLRDKGLWTNDSNDYGPNWQTQRKRARARHDSRCQICGAAEHGREHDVHHIIPFRRFGSYQRANQLSNLVTLCGTCHRRAEAAVRMRSGLSGLATALGHLAPLFLMCDAHDVGIHADPQSSIAGGQPAIVIYDMVPAGIGFSETLFERHDNLIVHACQLVAECVCADGCPSCIGPSGEDGVGGKREALALLQTLSGNHGHTIR